MMLILNGVTKKSAVGTAGMVDGILKIFQTDLIFALLYVGIGRLGIDGPRKKI